MEPLMTSDEVAAYLRVDVVTIRRLVNRGELPAYRVGGEYRFMREELAEYLKRQRVAGSEETGADAIEGLGQLVRKFFGGGKASAPGLASEAFSKFTRRAQRALQLSQEEAQRLHHNYIGTEHLLLGLVREDKGIAALVLKSQGVELDAVRTKVQFIIGQGKHDVTGEVPLTPRAKEVLGLAVKEAVHLGHRFIGTEHLLLGLLREGEGIGAQVLRELGVNLNTARARTIELLNQPGTAQADSSEEDDDEPDHENDA